MLWIAGDMGPPLLLEAANIALYSLQSCTLKLLALHFWITQYSLTRTQYYIADEYRQATVYKQYLDVV